MKKFNYAGSWALTHSRVRQYKRNNLKSLFQKYTQCSKSSHLTEVEEQQQQARFPGNELFHSMVKTSLSIHLRLT